MPLLATSTKNAKRAFAQARALTTLLPIHTISALQVLSFRNFVAQMLVANFRVNFKILEGCSNLQGRSTQPSWASLLSSCRRAD
jgi:hypothetical protein